jgi:hypothetical protein
MTCGKSPARRPLSNAWAPRLLAARADEVIESRAGRKARQHLRNSRMSDRQDLNPNPRSKCASNVEKKDLVRSGQWQVMTPEEQVRIKGQMAEGHLSTDDVGKMATRAGVKTVVLTHLTWKADDDYSTWADEVKKHFSGPVLIAKDLKDF